MMSMKFDCIVIGGGVAGLCCALRAQQSGLNVAVISNGQSALHFASGSVDLLSRMPIIPEKELKKHLENEQPREKDSEENNYSNQFVIDPFLAIEKLEKLSIKHPYSRLGLAKVKQAMEWFENILKIPSAQKQVILQKNSNNHNQLRITALGHFRSTWLSPKSVFNFPLDLSELPTGFKLALIDISDFRDYQSQLAFDNLKKLSTLKHIDIKTIKLNMDFLKSLVSLEFSHANYCEFRSIDYANLFDNELFFNKFVESLKLSIKNADLEDVDLVVLPALLSSQEIFDKLEQRVDFKLCELATISPSLLGIRLEKALKTLFTEQGGNLLLGDKVISGEFINNKLTKIFTQNQGEIELVADNYLIANGSFFSSGLIAKRKSVIEPVFGLDIAKYNKSLDNNDNYWNDNLAQTRFFSDQPHSFLSMGVDVNDDFQAMRSNKPVENLYCAGAMLAHYNPVYEGSGCGVAISTGFAVANAITAKFKIK